MEYVSRASLEDGEIEEGEISAEMITGCSCEKRNIVYMNDRTIFHDPSILQNGSLKSKLNSVREKYEDLTYEDYERKKQIQKIDDGIKYCLEKFGLWCAYKVAQNMESHEREYLMEILKLIEDAFPTDINNCGLLKAGNIFGVKDGLLTPKIHALLGCLLSWEYEDMCCLIVVESPLAALAISSLMKGLGYFDYEHFNKHYVVGSNNVPQIIGWKMERSSQKVIGFKKVDIVVTTEVDVERYNCVIHYDLPNINRSYILSNQEADQNEPGYIVLLERGNKKQHDMFYNLVMGGYSARGKEHIISGKEHIISGKGGNAFQTNHNGNIENKATSSLQMITEENKLNINLSPPQGEGGNTFQTSYNGNVENEATSSLHKITKENKLNINLSYPPGGKTFGTSFKSNINENEEDFDIHKLCGGLELYANLDFEEDEGGDNFGDIYIHNENIISKEFSPTKVFSNYSG